MHMISIKNAIIKIVAFIVAASASPKQKKYIQKSLKYENAAAILTKKSKKLTYIIDFLFICFSFYFIYWIK